MLSLEEQIEQIAERVVERRLASFTPPSPPAEELISLRTASLRFDIPVDTLQK
jgi:hypothetical protein